MLNLVWLWSASANQTCSHIPAVLIGSSFPLLTALNSVRLFEDKLWGARPKCIHSIPLEAVKLIKKEEEV
jgi:hypothetical protein